MKRLLFIIFLLPGFAIAQDKPLFVEGSSPELYILHTVAPKENYYSIGRLYNISPKEIAPFNKLQLEKGLNPGQPIRIPLNNVNFLQDGTAAPDEALVPIYYIVKEKEGLYRVGVNHNKVPVAVLKQWNNLPGETVSNGTRLIVGYLKIKKDQSALSQQASIVKPAAKSATPLPEISPAEKVYTAADKPVVTPEKTIPVVEKSKPPVITERSVSNKNTDGGSFKSTYSSQTKNNSIENETGEAGVFKSTSGWEDGKYYCLHDTAPAGTIIKITSTLTGKSVYAKVLDVMPDIKQNTGILVRVSNAAAAALGVGENSFTCTLNFSK